MTFGINVPEQRILGNPALHPSHPLKKNYGRGGRSAVVRVHRGAGTPRSRQPEPERGRGMPDIEATNEAQRKSAHPGCAPYCALVRGNPSEGTVEPRGEPCESTERQNRGDRRETFGGGTPLVQCLNLAAEKPAPDRSGQRHRYPRCVKAYSGRDPDIGCSGS